MTEAKRESGGRDVEQTVDNIMQNGRERDHVHEREWHCALELLEREVHRRRVPSQREGHSLVETRGSVKDGDERARRHAAVWFKAALVAFFMHRLSQGAPCTPRRLACAYPRALLRFHRLVSLRREGLGGTPLLCIRWARSILRVPSKALAI